MDGRLVEILPLQQNRKHAEFCFQSFHLTLLTLQMRVVSLKKQTMGNWVHCLVNKPTFFEQNLHELIFVLKLN
jgi:hypothetical protein